LVIPLFPINATQFVVLKTIKGSPKVSCDIPELIFGKRTNAMYLVQSLLSFQGLYPKNSITNLYGTMTRAGIVKFQKKNTLPQTGKIDTKTAKALQTSASQQYKECAKPVTPITVIPTATSTPTSTLPDLAIEGLHIATSTPAYVGSPFILMFDTVNFGNANAVRSEWLDSIYMKPRLQAPDFELLDQSNGCGSTPVIRPGRACTTSQTLVVNIPGVYAFTVSADDQKWLKESDETNNQRSIIVTVSETPH